MKAFEIRAKAREALKGQWGKVILLLVIYFIITFVLYTSPCKFTKL